MSDKKIPASVIVMTRNNGTVLSRCLTPLADFGEVFVVDSASADDTAAIAGTHGATLVPFIWNGRYPKKKQWCLENLPFAYDWVLYVDADEVLTKELIEEIRELFVRGPDKAGFFIKGLNVVNGKALRFGGGNNKLCLLKRDMFAFPVVDDLDMPGGHEVEGHYQPQPVMPGAAIGRLKAPLWHYIEDGPEDRESKRRRYALWESAMNKRKAWPKDPLAVRQALKTVFRAMPLRPVFAFSYSYVFRLGFLNGNAGLKRARDHYRYYNLIRQLSRQPD